MSKHFTLILSVLALITIVVFIKTSFLEKINGQPPQQSLHENENSPDEPAFTLLQGVITKEDKNYKYSALILDDAGKLHLFPNFADKLTSDEAISAHNCKALTSGGFYTMESTPLGLFVSEGRQIKSKINSDFYNGIFSVFYDNNLEISTKLSDTNTRIALQSGPILVLNGKANKFSQKNENEDRRVALAITSNNELLIIIFYKEGSVFMGPQLQELANLVIEAAEQQSIQIKDALNLDGGSASAFKADKVNLSEITPVGSFFCLQ